MLAAIFVSEGLRALRHPERLTDTAKPMTDVLGPAIARIHPKLPTDPKTLVRVTGAAQIGAALLLGTGRATTPAALALAGTLVPTTVAAHPFWDSGTPTERAEHRTQFLKNIGLLGGLLFAALDHDGRPDLSWRAGHLIDHARRRASREARKLSREARKLTN
jgi:putative oxidoreductase